MPLQMVVRDTYKERDIGRFTGTFSDIVEAHGVLALRLTPTKCCSAPTYEALLSMPPQHSVSWAGTAMITNLAHLTTP